MSNTFRFTGVGDLDRDTGNWRALERLNLAVLDDPRRYVVFDPDLVEAVNTAMALGMPLLLTGEPGVGKSTLAARLAAELQCRLLEFRVKSVTEGADVLYQIDHIRRMTDANVDPDRARDGRNYVRFGALGLAILHTWSKAELEQYGLLSHVLSAEKNPEEHVPSPTVVLIDEIDKAPTDVPNDLLEELRTLSFKVPHLLEKDIELGLGGPLDGSVSRAGTHNTQFFDARLRPIVLITSNSERALPQAFLRRCVYYNMSLPEYPTALSEGASDDDKDQHDHQLQRFRQFRDSIDARVDALLQAQQWYQDPGEVTVRKVRDDAWATFCVLRSTSLQRRPSTGELLSWLCAVHNPSNAQAIDTQAGWRSLACLLMVKHRDDLALAHRSLTAASP